MWSIVDDLRQRRRALDELLDYRYSQLTLVFARLVFEGHLDEKQLPAFRKTSWKRFAAAYHSWETP